MRSAASHSNRASTLLLLDTVIKQARELRGEVIQAELYPAEVARFERVLSEIEGRALKLFATLV